MKFLEETPDFICSPSDVNYVCYSDTDSIYINAEPLLRHLHPLFDEMLEEEKDDALEQIALKCQDAITESYGNLAKEAFNAPKHRLEMKTEAVIRSAYFRATRRYAQWITKKEGLKVEELDIKGLEFKKSNFPPLLRDFFMEILDNILKGTPQSEIDDKIKEFRLKFLNINLPFTDLGNPTSVKTLNDYIERKPKAGEIFSLIKKGAPAPVKAAIKYNDLINLWGLSKEHTPITPGDKIKWVYLKPNLYYIEALAFLDWDIPPKILGFIEENLDRQKTFDSILLNKLENFYDDLGWVLSLNENKHKFFNND